MRARHAHRCPARRRRGARGPEFEVVGGAPEFWNDEYTAETVLAAFHEQLGDQTSDFGRLPGSADFPTIANAWGAPYYYYYWVVGSSDNPNAPYNHSPKFAPDLDPVLDLSTRAILAGISPWLMQN